ncbi:uncharacterized protein K460DRAFT_290859, partial [Cucurbitaria berberidis CBS 394.84]
NSYKRRCVVDNREFRINLQAVSDIPGDYLPGFVGMHGQLRRGDMYMLVYSITSRASFTRVTRYPNQILQWKDKSAYPMLIVRNHAEQGQRREVSTQEGIALARETGCHICEISADYPDHLQEAFLDLVRARWRYEDQKYLRIRGYEDAITYEHLKAFIL